RSAIPCPGRSRGTGAVWCRSRCRSYGYLWRGGDEAVTAELKALLVLATLEVVSDAVHEVEAVVRRTCAAHADQHAGPQDMAVAQHIQRARDGDRVVRVLDQSPDDPLQHLDRLLVGHVPGERDLGRRRGPQAQWGLEDVDVGDRDRDGNLAGDRIHD